MNVGFNSKGSVLFKEKKISDTTLFLLISIGFFVIFVFFSASMYMVTTLLRSVMWGVIATIMFIVITLPILYNRRMPLVIYENGLDAPISVLKFTQRKKRFCPFSNIKNIYPKYVNIGGAERFVGFTVITRNEEKIDITEMEESKLKKIEETIKTSVKEQWKSLYVNHPYIGFEELQRMSMQLKRSKKSVWIEGFGIILLSFVFFTLSLAVITNLFFIFIVTPACIFAILIGTSRITLYYQALTNYKKIIKTDPALMKAVSISPKIEIKDEDPLQKVKKFNRKDWVGLERSINDRRPLYFMLIGFITMIIAMAVQSLVSFMLFGFILFGGMGIMMSALLFVPRLTKDIELVRKIIKQELRSGEKILPNTFNIQRGFINMVPFREAPKYNSEQWMKLVRSSKLRNEKYMAFLMVLLTAGIAFSIVLPISLDLPGYVGLGIMTIVMITILGHMFTSVARLNILRAIEAFEEESKKKVIPQEYRSKIYTGWRSL